MARSPSAISRYGAFNVRVEGLDEMLAGVTLGAREIAEVWREILRGPFGRDFLRELKARTSDAKRTTYTLSRMKVHDYGREGVEIGIPSSDTAQHPASKRANAKSIGVWIESGTRMHMIPTKISPTRRLAFGGRVVSRVTHPGQKALRPMYHTLRVYRQDWDRLFIAELDRRLAPRMNLR